MLVKPLKHYWYLNSPVAQTIIVRFVMTLQQAFGHLLPILHDMDLDFIPNPIANSTALDAAADDHADDQADDLAFSNILSDASRVLLNVDTLPPTAPELSDEEDPTDSGVVLSSLKFYTGRKRGQSCSYNGFLYTQQIS